MKKKEKLLKEFKKSRQGQWGLHLSEVVDILEEGFTQEELKLMGEHIKSRIIK